MHVILKPFIKLAIMLLTILGIAELAGVDVEGLIQQLTDMLGDSNTEAVEDESTTEAETTLG